MCFLNNKIETALKRGLNHNLYVFNIEPSDHGGASRAAQRRRRILTHHTTTHIVEVSKASKSLEESSRAHKDVMFFEYSERKRKR